MYRIRRATHHELDDVVDMDNVCFPQDAQARPRASGTLWWVAETGEGKLAAYGGVTAFRDRALMLDRYGVLPPHRGEGLQRRMINVHLAYAKRARLAEAWTYTDSENVVSSNNLIRGGFTLWSPTHWPGYLGGLGRPQEGAWLYWRKTTR